MLSGTISRRAFLTSGAKATTSFAAASLLHLPSDSPHPGTKLQVDVCVYGGVSGGVIAAIALARLGRSVALVEPTRHIGGMTTGGLGWVDVKAGGIRAFAGITGEYFARVRRYYADRGVDVAAFGNDGAVAEPHVAELVLEQMLAEQARHITVVRESRLTRVIKEYRRLKTLVLDRAPVDARGAPAPTPLEASYLSISAAMFLDTSYEGDLLAAAGVSHRGDREGRAEFNEPYAGVLLRTQDVAAVNLLLDPYKRPGDPSSGLLPLVSAATPGVEGSPSPYIQAYNFRLCLVQKDPIPIAPPANYTPATYEIVARMLLAQAAAHKPFTATQMHLPGQGRLLKFSRLPSGKTDVNNASDVSMDFVTGGAERYAAATWAERARLWHAHEDYQRGLYHFLQTDPRVDEGIRADLATWGLPRDEFRDTGGWPTQLYVREARRMVGNYVMRQSDCLPRTEAVADAVAVGTYSLDSHTCQRLVYRGRVVGEGGFLARLPNAYSIPYPVLTPRAEECENLLVTFCVSSTHVCFASVRMEPPFMVMSESAAIAAHLALQTGCSVQAVSTSTLQTRLREANQIVLPAQIPTS